MIEETETFAAAMETLALPLCICGHSEEQHFNDGGDYTSDVTCEAADQNGRLCPCKDYTDASDPQVFTTAAPFPAQREKL